MQILEQETRRGKVPFHSVSVGQDVHVRMFGDGRCRRAASIGEEVDPRPVLYLLMEVKSGWDVGE